jgi:hypothetical protein
MVCTMAANNETGTISDLDGIAGRAARDAAPRAYWMVDCVQALGKLPLDLANTRIDYAPFSGHKLYAPKGIGMLYVRDGAPYTPLIIGGGQEAGQRSGTENMAGIAALGAVLAALEEGDTFRGHAALAAMRERLAAAWRGLPRHRVQRALRTGAADHPELRGAGPGRARSCSTCSTPPACASARARPVRRRRPRPATCWRRWACRRGAPAAPCACPSGRWSTTPSSPTPAPASRAAAPRCAPAA